MPENFGELIQPAEKAKIWTQGFESPRRIIGLSGNIALGTDKGLRDQNQDALVLDIRHNSFAVIDGMGGYDRGDQAAIAVAESIQNYFDQAATDPRNLHIQAHRQMRELKLERNGAAYLMGQVGKNGKELSVSWSGDSQLIVIDTNGKIKYVTPPTSLEQVPTGQRAGWPQQIRTELKNYDLVVAGTDGLWDNVMPEEVAGIVSKFKVNEALPKLADYAKTVMNDRSVGNPDNLTIFIYQILPAPLRGK